MFQSENISLRNKVEELERQLRSNMMVKESCMEKQIKTHKLFDSLTVYVNKSKYFQYTLSYINEVVYIILNKFYKIQCTLNTIFGHSLFYLFNFLS